MNSTLLARLVQAAENDIGSIARQGIALVEEDGLRNALDAAYRSARGVRAVETAQRVFRHLTSSRLSPEILCRFLWGWRSIHGTALFVSGLMIRLNRKAREAADKTSGLLLGQAGAEIGEIIAEDTGVDDTPHDELFLQFANQIVGDDRWQLACYALPVCDRFRRHVKQRRLAGPIDEAILTTAASENWNAGEYTYFDTLVGPWLTGILGQPEPVAVKNAAYVTAHSGATELAHFLHALKAWKLYSQATGQEADPLQARQTLEWYLDGIAEAFDELGEALGVYNG
jgi:hypothetical protein